MAKNLISEMKERIAKSGTSKRDVLYFAPDSQKRVRFLQELDTGHNIQFHNDYNAGIFCLCQDMENHEDCKMCEEGIAINDYFAWSVFDYDSNEVKILNFKPTGVSPIPALIEMFEEFGTIMDRDYKIKKVGKGTGGSFVVTPMDKSRFRANAKPYSKKELLKIMEAAFPVDKDTDSKAKDDDEDEEDEVPVKKSKAKKGKKKEPSLREKYENLDMKQLKEIALELGITKKEFKNFEDEEEVLDEFFDNYEESDLEELLENLEEEEDDEEDDD